MAVVLIYRRDEGYPDGTFTAYQWRTRPHYLSCLPAGQWHMDKEWADYDGNDTYNGLPRALERIYFANLSAINQHFNSDEDEPSPQPDLFIPA